jgi:HEAT repeat protein
MERRVPAEGIRLHSRVIAALSDDELISRITRSEPLPDADDDDPAWLEDATWDRLEFLLAAADAIGDRQLVDAIGPLFQRAALGDGYDLMQGLRHGVERAVAQNWSLLADIMRQLTRDRHGGCRRWAVRELGILRDPRALNELGAALSDVQPLVRCEACMSLGMLAEAMPDACPEIRARLQRAATADISSEVRRHAQYALERIT